MRRLDPYQKLLAMIEHCVRADILITDLFADPTLDPYQQLPAMIEHRLRANKLIADLFADPTLARYCDFKSGAWKALQSVASKSLSDVTPAVALSMLARFMTEVSRDIPVLKSDNAPLAQKVSLYHDQRKLDAVRIELLQVAHDGLAISRPNRTGVRGQFDILATTQERVRVRDEAMRKELKDAISKDRKKGRGPRRQKDLASQQSLF